VAQQAGWPLGRRKARNRGAAAESYAANIVTTDLDNPNSDSVFSIVRRDFDAKGVAQSDHQIRRTMDEAMEKAIVEIQTGR
jgi:hypothetical protein